jgi:hypothetical protein
MGISMLGVWVKTTWHETMRFPENGRQSPGNCVMDGPFNMVGI